MTRSFGSIRKRRAYFEARYVGPNALRYTLPTKFVSKGDASRALARVETEISRGSWEDPKKPQAADNFAVFAAYSVASRGLKPKTEALYRGQLTRLILPTFGGCSLVEITPRMVRDWFSALGSAHPTQNAQAYALLASVMKHAVEDRQIEVTPCQIRRGTAKKISTRSTTLEVDEVSRLADLMGGRYRAMVLVAAFACLRFGEIAELRRCDLVGNVLHVRRGVTWVKDEVTGCYETIIGTPKSTAGIREITLPDAVLTALEGHMALYAQQGPTGLLFPSEGDTHMLHATMYSAFTKARNTLGRDTVRFHDLRHTGATLYGQHDATLRELMDLLGHETPRMALHYQHVGKGRMQVLANNVGASLPAAF